MKNLYIVDASGFLYRSYFAIRNMTNAKGESTNALFGFIRSILKLMKDFHPDHLVAVYDGPRSIQKRLDIYTEYKAHRAVMPQDLRYQIEWAQKFCDMMGIPYLNVPDAEADDVIGSVATWASQHETMTYICTSDKDLCQLVQDNILILNNFKDNQILDKYEVEKIHGVPPKQMIDLLAIVGDSSDNVPGLPGFGPKTAAELLKSFGSLDYILQHPHEVPGTKKQETLRQEGDKALLSRRLVTIDINVEFPKDKTFFAVKQPDMPALKEFYAYMNFNTLMKELLELESSKPASAGPEAGGEQYKLVDDEESFQQLLTYLSEQKEICFDTETTDYKPLLAELVGIGFAVEPKTAWYVPVNGKLGLERVLKGVKPLFENPRIGFYGHNVKYDYHVLNNYGITVKNLCFDTILASFLLNSHIRQHSLDALALEYFSKVKIPISDLIGKGKKQISMRDVPIEKVCTYCCEDADYTCRLKQVLENSLRERKLDKLLTTLEMPLSVVLAEMERHGIYLDVPKLQLMSTEVINEIASLEQQIYQMAGIEFNINSPIQLKKILFERLAIPYPKKRASDQSTGEEILELLMEDFPIARKVLEYRKLEKLRSTYIDSLPLEVNPKTQRVHCTFSQFVAATGRLASQDPNLQNIPVRTAIGRKIREAFRPEKPGWSFLAADYSQIELRLMAHFSQDPNLIQAFKNNEDIHVATAAAIYNIPLQEVTKEQRQSAKAVNFGIIYGQQAFGLSQGLNISPKEAAQFIETYFQRFQKVKEYLEHSKEEARKQGRAITYTGRERLIPEIHSKNSMLRAQAERLAINTPIQGSAADLIKMAMLRINQLLHQQKKLSYMLLQIHDELIFEVPDFEIMDMEHLVRNEMENVFRLKVPLIVDITVGKNWKEC